MWETMGASVRGPGHRSTGQVNQDAWLTRRAGTTALAVVCDGLGSRPHSATGSRAACRAVADAVRLWSVNPDVPIELLLRTIHALWNIRVHALGRDECATTCLFAAATPDGRLVLAQLGDGLVLASSSEGVTTLEPQNDRFGNNTTGLGIAADLRDWRVHLEPRIASGTTVLLATDGIADDILPEKRVAFLEFLVDQFGTQSRSDRARSIAKELRDWPTPLHQDDKTVAVLWTTRTMEAK